MEGLAQREHQALLREHREDAGRRAVVLLADERGGIHGVSDFVPRESRRGLDGAQLGALSWATCSESQPWI